MGGDALPPLGVLAEPLDEDEPPVAPARRLERPGRLGSAGGVGGDGSLGAEGAELGVEEDDEPCELPVLLPEVEPLPLELVGTLGTEGTLGIDGSVGIDGSPERLGGVDDPEEEPEEPDDGGLPVIVGSVRPGIVGRLGGVGGAPGGAGGGKVADINGSLHETKRDWPDQI